MSDGVNNNPNGEHEEPVDDRTERFGSSQVPGAMTDDAPHSRPDTAGSGGPGATSDVTAWSGSDETKPNSRDDSDASDSATDSAGTASIWDPGNADQPAEGGVEEAER